MLSRCSGCCTKAAGWSATLWTASVHTLHVPKSVITFVCKVLAAAWAASLHTSHIPKTCDDVRVQSATAWTASVHTLHMPKLVI